MSKKPDTSGLSPFRSFSREKWAKLRADTPMTLSEEEVADLSGLSVQVSLDEVAEIYLPLSRLLSLYVEASQDLFRDTQKFLGGLSGKVPYIIGMGGSVAVGKSTTARILRKLLARWPNHPKVDLLTTDGFLQPNAVLEERGLMNRKGFPESYNVSHLLRVLSDIKAGHRYVEAPVYSHLHYDVSPVETVRFDQPDILIVEGINVLQVGTPPADGEAVPFVSDFFDFSVYIDARAEILREWYVERFFRLRETAFQDPESYFHRYASLTDKETHKTANQIWDTINLVNLRENVQPTRHRADLILHKGVDHEVEEVFLRKL
ncbi:MAG: type I pantothenate kinase [Alphaproteobacteria bacterium]|nr:type I pantothenate kinase [Alphaproteobacteria bacterium]